jgi:hypothetical protein
MSSLYAYRVLLIIRRKLESVNLNPIKNPIGKIVRKDYLLTAVERRDVKLRDPPRGKTFYRDDNTTPYGIALLRL